MASNPQWKVFQPQMSHSSPMHDIIDLQQSNMPSKQSYRNGTYSSDYPSSPRDNYNMSSSNRYNNYNLDASPIGDTVGVFSSSSSNTQHTDSHGHAPIRETGIIEKLLNSYGFIQCCERQARLFFHFSQFSGNIEHLKIGDPVEFEMTYDRRTGKPIASTVTKIAPEVVLSEARVTGTVTTELKGEGSGDNTGRISYENRGECFFLPYTKEDIEGNVSLRSGDAVSFQIATNQRGTLGACHIRFENPVHPVKYHGVICSMKEKFGFIERADVVKEIFFHFSEAKPKEELNLGDDVEFIIQTRNGKEVACNLCKMPSGSVVFEDVSPEVMRGQVLKSIDRSNTTRPQNDPLPGRIRYRAADHSEVEVPFGDKDQSGEFTLRHGDWVQFQVATDRRDQLNRATNISLLNDSFNVSGEKREQGVVASLKSGFGFIQCVEREQNLMFHFAEVLRMGQELSVGDEVEFTVDPITTFANSNTRQTATRIKHLPSGTVTFENLMERGIRGVVAKEATETSNGTINSQSPISGTQKKSVPFGISACESKLLPRVGDKVVFDVYMVKRTKELIAMGVQMPVSTIGNNNRTKLQGFIAALKDGFGFIENLEHSKEVFFHFSTVEGKSESLYLGCEVEYVLGRICSSGGSCASAELVRILPAGTIPLAKALDPTFTGNVTRTLRSLNPDQQEYSGLIQVESGGKYEFGIMGLSSKRELLQVSDPVTFQVDEKGMATNIVPIRKKRRATIDALNGSFGFLSLDGDECKRLFFHMSEVRGNSKDLHTGDIVEFVTITNPRNGKTSACNVVKISKARRLERPERLVSRIRNTSHESGSSPRVITLRAPRGPDGTRGFRPRRPIEDLLMEESLTKQ